ncbi:phospholipase C, phosphocholine-specific [Pedobacter sp. MC2016-14]|uniref:phosphocholine-specific phospholipase C n=1 Tax=Pedobacter sp. MC2016-14 TaxID=2897327 RepID=UPI001E62EF3E|nr:phospholipase C, phosphocholine-specific [Pedobacter sp. MC2016-14]MCD0488564.1 phospholipase C, phosphocholine-specific [Pedobacter sp. MC2016-14]
MTKDTRREFIKKAGLLTGAAGLFSMLPESIQKALAIDAEKGSTYLDAEHVVFLMQENRSFDHCYGTLQGVRGFDDPRAMRLPNQNKVWMQTNKAGETHIPFNLNIKESNATWMQSLPHSWENQVDARNGGDMDNWLESKKSGNPDYASMPLTMGFYDRKDIPFYYALADAFTVCDQHFCSALTGTSANRSYFWSGTIREEQHKDAQALVFNDEINFKDLTWKTFPERLEEIGVSWKIYQNELSIDVGFDAEHDDWLSNFTDNNLEFHKQYNVRLHKAHLAFLARHEERLTKELERLKALPETAEQQVELKEKAQQLQKVIQERREWNQERFDKLSEFEKHIHNNAFVTNTGDPHYHQLEYLNYQENGIDRAVAVPKGDVLFQFRKDVQEGKLPMVSWLAAAGNFSDHPHSPWYGAWYVSEVLDILTKNPEVWKKTIFILTYDENDGYFDHVAPFVPPHSDRPETGKCSPGLDTNVEFVTKEDEINRGRQNDLRRESPIGLGFRVPMVMVSPWSKGGWVNSEVFDHTSCLQFLETFIQKKSAKTIKESNISDWRRTVCGDLTSVFRPYNGEKVKFPTSIVRDDLIASIHQAKFKAYPRNYKALTENEIREMNKNTFSMNRFPRQEKGQRPSCALPYVFKVDGYLDPKQDNFVISMASKGVGAPFTVSSYTENESADTPDKTVRNRYFAVKGNDEIVYQWPLNSVENGQYHLVLNGPNGFCRKFKGNANDPSLRIHVHYTSEGDLILQIKNTSAQHDYKIFIRDKGYGNFEKELTVRATHDVKEKLNLGKSQNWYDFDIVVDGAIGFVRDFAGRVENGRHGFTDPQIGAGF